MGDTVRTLLHETRNDMSERKKRQYNEKDFTCSLLYDFCMFIKDIEESPKESGKN